MASTSSLAKVCFNSNCNGGSEVTRKGWRRRTGECADLCDRCGSAFEDGKFCETFHLNASGWRSCESCGKQIHCGCIVSFHMFVLLDAGGIECLTCTKKSFILTPNPAWPPPSILLPALPETSMDIPVRSWSSIAGSEPMPWRQEPSVYSSSTSQSKLQPKLPFEVSISVGSDRSLGNEQLPAFITDRKKKDDSSETSINGSVKLNSLGMFGEGATGNKCDRIPKPLVNAYQQSSILEDDSATLSDIPVTSGLRNGVTDPKEVSGSHVQRPTNHLSTGKQFCSHNLIESSPNKVPVTRVQGPVCSPLMGNLFCSNNLVESSLEAQTRNGRPRKEICVRNQLLPRNRPRITDQDLKQISGDANAMITPLFEKVLSASDAGRIGRLVLPKKCAEAYLPPISQPEGLPLVVQDLNGKDWIFQFRFWPNNNSRMYVLEGITSCIQSMELQAGDTVTFNRLEPEGKLVMGYRKASISSPADRGDEAASISKVVSSHGDVSIRIVPAKVVSTNRHSKGSMASTMFLPINQGNMVDPASAWSDVDKSGYIAKEVIGAEVAFCSKRKKNSNMNVGSKCLRNDNDDPIQLNVTFGEVQRLLRPHPNVVPAVMMIEGIEIQEHQDAPIIGRPTLFEKDNDGEDIQWVQCEDCFKWRKVPVDALLPSKWTCTKNSWDPERSLCSADEESTPGQLEKSLPLIVHASKKRNCAKLEPGPLDNLDRLDALAQLAMQEEGDGEGPQSSSQITTRHPRHRSGCSCIVCIQPPSGKAHKHKSTCTCNVCLTVKRRFQTLMLRREQKQSEKEAVNARQKLHPSEFPKLPDDDIFYTVIGNGSPNRKAGCNEDSDDDKINKVKTSTSPFKSPIIDLNIQPEREDELPPTSDSIGMTRLLQDTTDRFIRQHHFASSCSNGIHLGSANHDADTTGG